jgi:hypothetical protein
MPLVSQTFDQLLDFTRTTSGTFVGSNGLVQTTPASVNLLTYTQQFDNAAWVKNALSASANTSTAPDSTGTADTLTDTATTANHYASQNITTTAATTYTMSAYVKNSNRGFVILNIADLSGATNYAAASFNLSTGAVVTTLANGTGYSVVSTSVTSAGNGWYRCTMTAVVGTTTAKTASVALSTAGTIGAYGLDSYLGDGSSLFVWGAQLEAASAATTYTRNNGGVYPARFDCDPVTLQPKGILIEEQRTNLFTQSEFANGVTDAPTRAGLLTATTFSGLIGTTGLAFGYDGSTSTYAYKSGAVDGTTYTVSAYVRMDDGNAPVFGSATGAAASNTFALVVGGNIATPTSYTVMNMGGGLYRVSGTAAAGAAVSNSGVIKYGTNNNRTFKVSGYQLEAGEFATSYIPTVASQVTRTADQCAIVAPNFAPWYNQSEGTFVFEGTSLATTGFSWPVVASDNTTANRFAFYKSGTSLAGFMSSSGATQMEITSAPAVANVVYKIAMAAEANSGNFSFNGDIGSADTSITMPTVNRLSLGASASGSAEYLNGHIRSVRYYPVRLSDAQLQALTA